MLGSGSSSQAVSQFLPASPILPRGLLVSIVFLKGNKPLAHHPPNQRPSVQRLLGAATSPCERSQPSLPQCATGRTRTAVASPSPPAESAKVDKTRADAGALGVPKIWQRHVHTLSSWRPANVSVSAGLRARSQKLALVAPHMRRSRNATWVSFTARRELVVRQIGSPRNAERKPLGQWAPREPSTPVGLAARWGRHATPLRLATTLGLGSRPPLHSAPCLLCSNLRLAVVQMDACAAHNSSSMTACNLSTLAGRDTMRMSSKQANMLSNSHPGLNCFQCWSSANNTGMRVALLPSPCGML